MRNLLCGIFILSITYLIYLSYPLNYIPDFIFIQRPIRTILGFQKYCTRFKTLQTMPLAFFYVENNTTRNHINGVC